MFCPNGMEVTNITNINQAKVYLLIRDVVARVFAAPVTFRREDSLRAGTGVIALAGLYQVWLTALSTVVLAATHQAFTSPVGPGIAWETCRAILTIIAAIITLFICHY